jgi:hypothetical protein
MKVSTLIPFSNGTAIRTHKVATHIQEIGDAPNKDLIIISLTPHVRLGKNEKCRETRAQEKDKNEMKCYAL